jgi:hypothetical protein
MARKVTWTGESHVENHMSMKRWYIVPVAAGMLALAATGGAIFAQGIKGSAGVDRHRI